MRSARHSSVRWRIVLIYFMLVFIAMTVVSVYLLERIEAYQLTSLKANIANTVGQSKLLESLGNYEQLAENSERIQSTLDSSWTGSFGYELSVVDKNLLIVASTNPALPGKSAAEIFDADIIVSCLMGEAEGESDIKSGDIPVKNLCYRITSSEDGEPEGVVYVRADLSDIKLFIDRSRKIFIQSIALALMVTVLLGFVLARSITVPINTVTKTVEKMSRGDFSTPVIVKSDDEIGQLAEMFNLLREKLDYTLSEISNEKNKLETILEYMGDGLVATDLEGNIIHINPAAERMLKIDRNEESLSYHDVLGHFTEELELEKVAANLEGEGEATFRVGNAVLALRYDRFKDEDGRDVGIIFIMQDITQRHKIEEMQTDFVANVSHELRTPLTNIKSYAETLLDGGVEDPETASNFLGIINSEADRMNRLVRDLLQLSRLDHSSDQLLLRERNVIAVIDSAITKLEIVAGQKKLQLSRLYDESADIKVLLDKDSLEQVLLNIIANAINYTNEGGRVDVDAYEHGGTVKVVVQDNGIGIPSEALPRIFERFYRVDKARSRAMGGTGLGLAISKQIVEGHGGSIEAESREGQGTKISMTLPLSSRRGIRNID